MRVEVYDGKSLLIQKSRNNGSFRRWRLNSEFAAAAARLTGPQVAAVRGRGLVILKIGRVLELVFRPRHFQLDVGPVVRVAGRSVVLTAGIGRHNVECAHRGNVDGCHTPGNNGVETALAG